MKKLERALRHILLAALLPKEGTKIPELARQKGFSEIFQPHLSPTEVKARAQETTHALETEEMVVPGGKGFVLTEAGRKAALAYLGIAKPPARLAWAAKKSTISIRNGLLIARALRVPTELREKDLERLQLADGLRAALLRSHYDLNLAAVPRLVEVRKALGWRLLAQGCSRELCMEAEQKQDFRSIEFVADVLMYAEANASGVKRQGGPRVLAARIADADDESSSSLVRAVLRRLVGEVEAPTLTGIAETPGPDTPEAEPAPVNIVGTADRDGSEASLAPTEGGGPDDIPKPSDGPDPDPTAGRPSKSTDFVDQVLVAARRAPGGHVEDHGVLINHVWRQIEEPKISLESFKRELHAAWREGRIKLGRAEMPHLLDPTDLAESKIEDRLVTLVFVRV